MIDLNCSEHTSTFMVPFMRYLDALPLAPWLALLASRFSNCSHLHAMVNAPCASRFSLFVSLFAPLHAPPARHTARGTCSKTLSIADDRSLLADATVP